MRTLIWILALLLAAAPGAWAAESTPVASTRATASLVTDVDSIAPGRPFHAALRLRLASGWHTYWRNPGDAGEAPQLDFTLPQGVAASPVAWPAPEREREGPLATYAYTGEVLLPVTITGATDATTLILNANWLVCSKICVPESGSFRLDLPAGDGAASAEAPLFAAAAARTPRPSPWPARIAPDGTLVVPGLTGVRDAWFAPATPGTITASAPQAVVQTSEALLLRLARDAGFKPESHLVGVLTVTDGAGQTNALEIDAAPGPAPAAPPAGPGLARLLGLALLGGLVLNLMPCVFPVLAVKAVGLAGLVGARRRQAVAHGGAYTAGVLAAFAVLGAALLAARAAGGAAGWGFQFQSPWFVAAIAWLLFAVGLNLSGVYAVGGGRLAGTGQELAARKGLAGSFFTGLLAVVVATPCTAPFMGVAVAGALAAPPVAALAVFLAMGLGLAAPYLALTLIPGLARLLPRPGRWMERLRQVLAFPMYAAAAWLVWVMSAEAGPPGVLAALAGIVLIGLAGWALGLAQSSGRRLPGWIAAGAALAALAVLPGIGAAPPPAQATAAVTDSEAFSPARLAALRQEGRPVFVDATAAWCVTCLVNERLVLDTPGVRRAFAERGVAYLRADWTRQDADITAFLRAHGRDGVPLYVFYPGSGQPPVLLPQILTERAVLDALEARSTSRTAFR
jgi:thiol:disulfide interchange protein